jgi:hypothetical protein
MPTKAGKITATPAAKRAAGAGSAGAADDSSLPDPTSYGKLALAAFLLAALALAIIMPAADLTVKAFSPPSGVSTQFGLLAGFYVAAQVIERLMELVTPFLPWWKPPGDVTDPTVKAAYTKADRAAVSLGIASLLGVAASGTFGLFFLAKFGIRTSTWVDIFFTGILIGGGTKPLHDFISLIQNKTTPTTGTGTS